jgi:hypothetical protein
MTELAIEDELALIKRGAPPAPPSEDLPAPEVGDPMAQLSATWQEATAPAPETKAKTPAEIDAELGLPPAETGLAPPPADDAGTWDVLSAAWSAETIKTDAWNDGATRRRSLAEEMWGLLSEEGRKRVWADRARRGWASMEELITAEAGRQAAASPDVARVWAGYPLSIDDFNRQIDAARLADLEEAQGVLDQPGGAIAEFLGTAGRAITDETSVMLLPFGLSGTAWRTIAGEAALGALGEAAVLPKEYRVARELDLPDPDPVSRIAMGFVAGGAFSAAIIGLGRGFTALKARADARRASLGETAPPGVERIDHEADIEEAEAYLRGDQTVEERLGGYEGGARAEAPSDGTLGSIVGGGRPARVVMANSAAKRSQPVEPLLESRLGEAVGAVYGPGYEVRVYSGGQPSAEQGGTRVGSVRHDHGKAADVHIYGPDGQQIMGDDLAPLAQYWAAQRYGGVGLEMEGGGIHLDIWETPPAGGGMAWNYSAEGGQYTPAQQAAIEAGMRGELPPLRGTPGNAAPGPSTALPPVGPDAPPDWERIRNGIFAGESGADWNALFGYQNRKGGKFSHIKPSEMTVDQWLAFQDPNGPYGQWVARTRPDPENGVATPMGAYQIVGDTLRAAKKALGLKGDEVMTPEMQDFIAQWIYREQGAGAWQGYRGPRDSYTPGTVDGPAPPMGDTSRGYTGSGQVAAGDDMRIDVDYEVVDYTDLIRASGDLQPRDRSRINSDEWIASTAARLDPALLMPSPNAATGTPIVGPDNIIESGNGRAAVIGRAYERVPDRAQAYRGAIEAAGFTIPAGVERPVLIARRKTPLDDAGRKRLVIEAQDSGVAQMTPTEVARATARNLQSPILSRLDPSQPLASDANGGFVRAALATLPRSARNAMFDPSGALNANGQRQLREALFARAWPDPDILARYTEGALAELKSLMEALETAAPSWAALRADIEAGLVTPDMDIGGHVLDAMRLIAAARELSAREGKAIAKAVQELLDDVDLLTGPVAPLTAALVRKMWRGGRAAPADEVAGFLTRYADEARKAGAAGGMFDTPSPRDVLRTIDPETFKDLPEDLGQARGFATRESEAPAEAVRDLPDQGFDQGAQSPEAEAVHAEIEASVRAAEEGPFGPVIEGYEGDWRGAAAELERRQTGEVPDALSHPEVGKIALVWGKAGEDDSTGYGLAKLIAWHPEVLDDLQGHLSRATIVDSRSPNRVNLRSDTHKFGVRLEFDNVKKTWLLTGFEFGKRRPERSSARLRDIWDSSTSPPPPLGKDSPDLPAVQDRLDPVNVEALAIDQARADLGEFADLEIDLPDGTTVRAGDILDDLDADRTADEAINTCLLNPAEAFTKGAAT